MQERLEARLSEVQTNFFHELKLAEVTRKSEASIADIVAQYFAEAHLQRRSDTGSVDAQSCAELSAAERRLEERLDMATAEVEKLLAGESRKREVASEEASARLSEAAACYEQEASTRLSEAAACYEQRLCEVATKAEATVDAKLHEIAGRAEKSRLQTKAVADAAKGLDESLTEGAVDAASGLSPPAKETPGKELENSFMAGLDRRLLTLERRLDNRHGVAHRRFAADTPTIDLPREQSTAFYCLQSL